MSYAKFMDLLGLICTINILDISLMNACAVVYTSISGTVPLILHNLYTAPKCVLQWMILWQSVLSVYPRVSEVYISPFFSVCAKNVQNPLWTLLYLYYNCPINKWCRSPDIIVLKIWENRSFFICKDIHLKFLII